MANKDDIYNKIPLFFKLICIILLSPFLYLIILFNLIKDTITKHNNKEANL